MIDQENFIVEDGELILSMFRCWDPVCNAILTVEAHDKGRCGGCQGIKFRIARYLTDAEAEAIKAGTLIPHKVDLNAPGVEPPAPKEVR